MKSQSSRHSAEVNAGVGKDIIKLQHEELNLIEINDSVISADCGAVSNFIGTTRNNFENKQVLKLEYEAYESMARKEMEKICAKIRTQWNVKHIAIYHRLGEVPVTKASVIIAISSAHRQESLQAVDFAINSIKSTVPIWKKEIYESDEPQWKENKECDWSNSKKSMKDKRDMRNQVKSESLENQVNPQLVQIRANNVELTQRIEAFIARKREQVNAVNVQEFCCHREQSDNDENSCARVDAILIRRKDSKSHVKVHRVLNVCGPQTTNQALKYKETICRPSQSSSSFSSVLDDRLSVTEKVLRINKPVPKDIYARLKNIEDRILFLEGVSPEYKDFLTMCNTLSSTTTNFIPSRKRTYSTAELDSKLHELEDKYVKKIKY
ncbi:molybdopterin synthase catalytic subunit isoform X2 [Prorops nasuta]|uniref:molybdopterin synthase catalytic subunit isoform X2 n=1 Tax=Prorops nasuta TaxID=863751 RepID=UPI0034CD6C8A